MAAPAPDGLWLPDLCRLPRLLAMLGLAQLTVLVVLLVPHPAAPWDVSAFVSASGYALWLALALSVSVLLCACRRRCRSFRSVWARSSPSRSRWRLP